MIDRINKPLINYRKVTLFAISLIVGIASRAFSYGYLFVISLAAVFLFLYVFFSVKRSNEEYALFEITGTDRKNNKRNQNYQTQNRSNEIKEIEKEEKEEEKEEKANLHKEKIENYDKFLKKLFSIVKNATIAIVVGVIIASVQIFWYNDTVTFSGKVVGQVKSVDKSENEIILEDIYFDGNKVSGDLLVSGVNVSDIDVGYEVSLIGKVEKSNLFSNYGNVNSKVINNKIKYQVENYQDFSSKFNKIKAAKIFEVFYKKVMKDTMSENSYAITMALMFGDTSLLSIETEKAFQTSGIAHVFAVSGLHIGVIYLFLKKLLGGKKFNKYLRLIIITLFMFFYAYICGLKPSQVRAFIMFTIILFAETFYCHNDKITTLSLAAIGVALYNPLSVFTAGFVLSFGAVLSIIMFTPQIADCITINKEQREDVKVQKGIRKEKKRRENKSGVAGIISAQIGTFPLMSYYFGYIPVFSLILNFLVVPIISFSFVYVLIFTPLSYLFSVNFLSVIDIILYVITNLLTLVSNLSFAVIYKQITLISLIFYYLICFSLSDYIFIDKKIKRIIALVLFVILIGLQFI